MTRIVPFFILKVKILLILLNHGELFMKKSTIITIVCFAIGLVVLSGLFVACTENNISNKLFGTTTTTTTTTVPTGENKDPVTYEPMNFANEDMTKYITLGQYKGLEVKVDSLIADYSGIDLQIHILLCQKDLHSKQLGGKITEKVIFNFDFTGYLLKEDGTRGEAFEGGAGTNQLAYIDGTDFVTVSASGLGGFIDGFAQGMLGMSVGETKSLAITFPTDYHSAEMAGKKVEFEVKVNYIAKTEFTDDAANYISNGQYKTKKEYIQSIKDSLQEELDTHNKEQIWNTILANATVIEIPQQQFDYIYNDFVSKVQYYVDMYAMYGMSYTFDQMLQMFGFADIDALKAYANDYIKNDLVYYAIMQAEQLEVTDAEYRAFLDTLIEQTGKTEEEIFKEYTEEYIKEQILYNKTYDFIMEQNKVVQK